MGRIVIMENKKKCLKPPTRDHVLKRHYFSSLVTGTPPETYFCPFIRTRNFHGGELPLGMTRSRFTSSQAGVSRYLQ